MKKIFVLILILSILLINALEKNNHFSFSDYFSFGELTVYTRANSSEFLPNVELNGSGKIVGESMRFDNVEPINLIKTLKADIKFFEYIENLDLTIIYCYTTKIHKTVEVKKETINLQIAHNDNYTVIGWPLILGSF